MVRAILSGAKTQTRRMLNGHPEGAWISDGLGRITSKHPKQGRFGLFVRRGVGTDFPELDIVPCPYGGPGDRLWVRENFCPIYPQDPTYNGGRPIEYDYAATYEHGYRLGDSLGIKKKWKPSIHMPRDASRITLEITSVRVERLGSINASDAKAEGIEGQTECGPWRNYMREGYWFPEGKDIAPQLSFASLWHSINGPDSWAANPWVWVIEFKRVYQQQ